MVNDNTNRIDKWYKPDDGLSEVENEYEWEKSDTEIFTYAEDCKQEAFQFWNPFYDDIEEDWNVYNLDQWTKEQKEVRGNRPMIVDDMCKPYVKQIIATNYENPTTFKVTSNYDESSNKVKVLSSTLRYFEEAGAFASSRSKVIEQIAVGAIGWFRSEFEEESHERGGLPNIGLTAVADPLSVYIDPDSTDLDGRDATFMVELIKGEDNYTFYFKDKDGNALWAEIKKGKVCNKGLFPSTEFPLTPCYGEHSITRGKLKLHGVIRTLRDKQRARNSAQAKIIEDMAFSGPPITAIDERAFNSNQKRRLAQSGTKPLAFIGHSGVDKEGNVVADPIKVLSKAPNLGAYSAYIQELKRGANESVGITPTEDGINSNIPESGLALLTKSANQDRGQLTYSEHLKISDQQVGRVMMDLVKNIVAAAGKVPVQDEKGNKFFVLVGNEHMVMNPQTGRLEYPRDPETGRPIPVISDLELSSDDVSISMQQAFAQRKDKGINQILELMSRVSPAKQEEMIPEIMEDLGIPNVERYTAILKGTVDGKEAIPPALQKQMAEADQKMQAMQAHIEELENNNQMLLAENKTQAQSSIAKTEMDNNTKVRLKFMDINNENNRLDRELEFKYAKERGDKEETMFKEMNKAEMNNDTLAAKTRENNMKLAADAKKENDAIKLKTLDAIDAISNSVSQY